MKIRSIVSNVNVSRGTDSRIWIEFNPAIVVELNSNLCRLNEISIEGYGVAHAHVVMCNTPLKVNFNDLNFPVQYDLNLDFMLENIYKNYKVLDGLIEEETVREQFAILLHDRGYNIAREEYITVINGDTGEVIAKECDALSIVSTIVMREVEPGEYPVLVDYMTQVEELPHHYIKYGDTIIDLTNVDILDDLIDQEHVFEDIPLIKDVEYRTEPGNRIHELLVEALSVNDEYYSLDSLVTTIKGIAHEVTENIGSSEMSLEVIEEIYSACETMYNFINFNYNEAFFNDDFEEFSKSVVESLISIPYHCSIIEYIDCEEYVKNEVEYTCYCDIKNVFIAIEEC